MIRIAWNYPEPECVISHNGQGWNVTLLVIVIVIPTGLTPPWNVNAHDIVLAILHHGVIIIHNPTNDRGPPWTAPGLDTLQTTLGNYLRNFLKEFLSYYLKYKKYLKWMFDIYQ